MYVHKSVQLVIFFIRSHVSFSKEELHLCYIKEHNKSER